MNGKNDKIAISLIIPIYNTEKFIERCLRSVFEQTFENVEYILINDCTPDNSMEVARQIICDYSDKNIIILENNENQGAAEVRNIGIRKAIGEFIIFLDSDDYIESTMLEDMYNKAMCSDADIVIVDYYINYPQKQIYKRQPAPSEGTECAKSILSGRLHSSNSNKLVKKELYTKNEISFIKGINMWEDMSTIPRVCAMANKVAYLPKAYLHYVQYNTNSYTTNYTDKSFFDIQAVIEILQTLWGDTNEYKKALGYLKLKAKIDFIMHSNGKKRKKLCRIYAESLLLIVKHPSLSFFHKILLVLEKYRFYFCIDVIIYLFQTGKRIVRAHN